MVAMFKWAVSKYLDINPIICFREFHLKSIMRMSNCLIRSCRCCSPGEVHFNPLMTTIKALKTYFVMIVSFRRWNTQFCTRSFSKHHTGALRDFFLHFFFLNTQTCETRGSRAEAITRGRTGVHVCVEREGHRKAEAL